MGFHSGFKGLNSSEHYYFQVATLSAMTVHVLGGESFVLR